MTQAIHNNLLIVDDNPYNRELILAVAEAMGCTAVEAGNGREALDHLKTHSFDLIFMDLLMPGLDGFETTRQIRQSGIITPIVAVSAISLKQDRTRSLESGCNAFLPKPLNLDEVKALIKKYTENQIQEELSPVMAEDTQACPLLKGCGLRVLLVEEEDERRGRFTHILEQLGFWVSQVPTGSAALTALEKIPLDVDLVISNLFTSDIDGLGLLKITKRNHPDLLFFIYTPHFDAETFQFAIQLGVDGIIPRDQFETSAAGMLESALYQGPVDSTAKKNAAMARQVSRAQAQLIRFGCDSACATFDVAYAPMHEAGGDMARCRRFNLSGRCGFMLADVAGHDIMASYISAIFLGILMSAWDRYQDPLDLLKIMNTELIKLGLDASHICATAVLWDRRRGNIKIATAGNPGGLLVHKNGLGSLDIRKLSGGGVPLGLLKDHDLYETEVVRFSEDDRLFLFSDGIPEDDLRALLANTPAMMQLPVSGISMQLIERIRQVRVPDDDMILLTLSPGKMPSNPETEFSFVSSYEGVDRACDWLMARLAGLIPGRGTSGLIMTAVREALLNAVEHGNSKKPDAYVDLQIEYTDSELYVLISDQGPGFDINAKLKDLEKLDGLQLGKRGLPLIMAAADQIEVLGGTLTLSFKRTDPPNTLVTGH